MPYTGEVIWIFMHIEQGTSNKCMSTKLRFRDIKIYTCFQNINELVLQTYTHKQFTCFSTRPRVDVLIRGLMQYQISSETSIS